MKIRFIGVVLLTISCFRAFSQPTNHTALFKYINSPDSTFTWTLSQRIDAPDGIFLAFSLQSQTWRTNPWKHVLYAYFPTSASVKTGFLTLQMDFDVNEAPAALKQVAKATNVPCAILCNIPNQPLFEGKEEEELINFTFEQFLATGDDSWPLLLPMVKSTVRAMDVLQAASQLYHIPLLKQFVVAGHSKRGHTAWLTAAVDSRVAGLIAQGFNTLHSSAQIPHYFATYGALDRSALAAKQVIEKINTTRGRQLITMVDAYTYRQQLTLPKLVIIGTNDDYTPVDALNLYWPGLAGSKSVLSLPNAGHVESNNDPRLFPTAYTFIRRVAHGQPMPTVESTLHHTEHGSRLEIAVKDSAVSAHVWIANSPTRDFRDAQWKMQSVPLVNTTPDFKTNLSRQQYRIELDRPLSGYRAIIGEVEFADLAEQFRLSTIPYVVESK